MITALLSLALQSTPAQPMEAAVLQQITTGVAVRLELPELVADPSVMKALKRRFGDRAILQGKLRGDGTIMVVTAYGETQPSTEWRKNLMVGKLVGLGQFELGRIACTEANRELEAPYANVSWHAFLSAADTCFDVTIGTLAKEGVSPIKRKDFEQTVNSARFAILRLCEWGELPPAVMEHMHEGLAHAESEAAPFLAGKAASADADWTWALAAAEVGTRARMPAADRLALYERVLADLAKIEKPSAPELVARMTALSGRAMALRDGGKLDDALAALAQAMEHEAAKKPIATAALEYDLATIHALKLDAPGAVAHLKTSIAADDDRRAYATRDAAFAGIGVDPELRKLCTPPK